MDEREIRTLLRREPRAGRRALFETYAGYGYAIVWQRLAGTGTHEDAEECVSDVFAEVFRSMDSIYEGSLKAYIGTLARRMAVNAFYRLTARGQPLPLEEAAALDDGTDVPADAEAAARAAVLLRCIQSLGEPDATIVLQRYFYDRTAPEIGRIVHKSAPAVRMRLRRALQRLRTMLEQEGIS